VEGWKRVKFGKLSCRRSMIALNDIIRILLSVHFSKIAF